MKRPWMPLYWADFLADTKHLDHAERFVYLLLIGHYWLHGDLPDDDRQLASITELPLRTWKKMRPTLQAFFYDGWNHKRIDAELTKFAALRAQKSCAGTKGVLVREMRRMSRSKSTASVENTRESASTRLSETDANTDAETKQTDKRMHTHLHSHTKTSFFPNSAREVPLDMELKLELVDNLAEPVAPAKPACPFPDPGLISAISPTKDAGTMPELPKTLSAKSKIPITRSLEQRVQAMLAADGRRR